MRRLDPPFPSFSLAMSRVPNFDVSRLPPYRLSCIERFYLYARVSARRPQDSLMTRVDYRYKEEVEGEEPASCARPVARREEAHNDAEDHPIVDDARACEAPEERLKLGRTKLAEALIELLDALRIRYPTLHAVRAFLAPDRAK